MAYSSGEASTQNDPWRQISEAVDEARTPVDQAWQRIQKSLDRLQQEYEKDHAVAGQVDENPILENKRSVNESVQRISSVIEQHRDKIQEANPNALTTFEELLVEVWKFFTQTGNPAWLRATAKMWGEQIARPISGYVAWFTEDHMTTDNSWTGPAADAYRDHLPRQKAAMSGINEAAAQMFSWLEEVATAIQSFWAGLALAFFHAAARLIAFLSGLLGLDTIMNPGEKAAQVILDLAELVKEVTEQFKNTIDDFKKIKNKMEEMFITQTDFPVTSSGSGERSWPRVGGGLSTAESHWNPRRH